MTTGYGLQTKPVSLAPGTTSQAITAAVNGLQPDRRFHYRLVATNSAGTTMGADKRFTTSPGSRTAPVSVSARTVPTVATAFPYRFVTTGAITLPSGVNRARACKGFVAVRFKSGSRTTLSAPCRGGGQLPVLLSRDLPYPAARAPGPPEGHGAVLGQRRAQREGRSCADRRRRLTAIRGGGAGPRRRRKLARSR